MVLKKNSCPWMRASIPAGFVNYRIPVLIGLIYGPIESGLDPGCYYGVNRTVVSSTLPATTVVFFFFFFFFFCDVIKWFRFILINIDNIPIPRRPWRECVQSIISKTLVFKQLVL